MFKRNTDSTISQIAKLHADDKAYNDQLGKSIAIDGDYIAVSTSSKDVRRGNVYIFKRNSDSNVSQIAKLEASDRESSDYFGQSVAMSGEYIVVGAFWEDTGGADAGSAYLFKRHSDSNISQIAKFQADDIQAGDSFGYSVDIDGDYIVVGAYQEDTTADNAGSVYLFKRNSDSINDVSQIAKIQSSDIEESDYFGVAVSISANHIVVGASSEDTGASSAGSTYVFRRNSDTINDISQIAKLQAIDGTYSNDRFGAAVSIDGTYIVVGANGKDPDGVDSAGNAYVFKINNDSTVSPVEKLQTSDLETGDNFGRGVSISGDYIVGSAFWENTRGDKAGAAYIFQKD